MKKIPVALAALLMFVALCEAGTSHRDALEKLIVRSDTGLSAEDRSAFLGAFEEASVSVPAPRRGIDYPYRSALAVLGTGLYLRVPLEDSGRMAANVFAAVLAGAPAEQAEDLADYGLVIDSWQVLEAANAIRDFENSIVEPRVYNELVLHSVEYKWKKGFLPVIARGLMYGAERGLDQEKAALAMMIDVDQGRKDPDDIVRRMVKTLRELYPDSWKPLPVTEQKLNAMRAEIERLDRLAAAGQAKRLEADIKAQQKIVAEERELRRKKEMDMLCKKNGIDFILMYIPSRIQVNKEYQEDYLNRNLLNKSDFDFESPSRTLKDFADSNDIAYLDLLERFNKLNSTGIYYEYDPHFNKKGSKIVSQEVSKWVISLY